MTVLQTRCGTLAASATRSATSAPPTTRVCRRDGKQWCDYYVATANSGACTACPVGSTNVAGDDNTGSLTDCDCPSNSVWNAGTGQCECNANYFARASDNTCQSCGTGYENAAGDVVASQSVVSTTACDLCAADYYVATANSGACTACPVGTTNVAGDVNTGSLTDCDCPSNSVWNAGTGQCECNANYFARASDNTCQSCGTGYENAAGDVVSGSGASTTACDLCAADYYVATANSGACTACPVGTTNVAGDVNTGSLTDCDCPSNSVWNAGTGQCECNANYFARASDNTCQSCGTGYENAAGDVVSGSGASTTACDLCAADYYVATANSGACTACPVGTTNVAGDVNTGSLTDCDCPSNSVWNAGTGQCECNANYFARASDNTCQPCGTGYENAAGDVVSGSGASTTACDLCAADYYVATANSGACTACPAGSTNVAGDDNTGSLTDCDCPSNSVWNAGTGCECNANYFVEQAITPVSRAGQGMKTPRVMSSADRARAPPRATCALPTTTSRRQIVVRAQPVRWGRRTWRAM